MSDITPNTLYLTTPELRKAALAGVAPVLGSGRGLKLQGDVRHADRAVRTPRLVGHPARPTNRGCTCWVAGKARAD